MKPNSSVAAADVAPARDERCQGPWCNNKVIQPETGRPAKYCSELCRKAVWRKKKQDEEAEQARIAREKWEAERQAERVKLLRELQEAVDVMAKPGVVDEVARWMVERDRYGGQDWMKEHVVRLLVEELTSRRRRAGRRKTKQR